jgi:site-specific DNA recombinase
MASPPNRDSLQLAFYGRYSSDLQSDSRIDDQLRRCQSWAQHNGHTIAATFEDRAVSGTSTVNRDGFQRLMERAFSGAPGFDGIVVDDLSRLSRDLGDTHSFIKRLRFRGLRVISVVDGIDTNERPSKVQVAVKGLLNEVYIDNLRDQTKRGLDGCFARGLSTGGKTFGYRSTPVDAADRDSAMRREVDPDEAEIVRQIFRRFAEGQSEKIIARDLNARSLGGKTWSPNVLWHMLRNPAYLGRLTFNRYEWVKNPDTGKRNYRERPESEWIVAERPELRIVEQEVWERAQQRISLRSQATAGKRGNNKSTRLLSGLVVCECGRRMTLNGHSYSCPAYFEQGVCSNATRFNRSSLESLVIRALKERLLPKIQELEVEVNRMLASGGNEDKLADLANEIARLDESIKNRLANSSRMALDKESLRFVSQLISQDRSRLQECRESFATLQRQTSCLDVDTGLIQDALEHLDAVLATDIDLAREFLAGMVTSILVRPLPPTAEGSRGIHCPLCGRSIKRLTPQHAAKHGFSVEEMAAAHPEFGVTQPIEVRIRLNMKDLLAKEEVVYIMVAGAGFEPATFGL